MPNSDIYTYADYMARLQALLMACEPRTAIVLADGIAATLNADGHLYGFYCDAPDQDDFDFDESAWNGESWDGESHAQTWCVLLAPVLFSPWR